MDVVARRSSSPSVSVLNPNAPLFVPMAYRTVEDFSDQWWALIQSSPWFREYWLQERFQDPQADPLFSDIEDVSLPDLEPFLEDFGYQQDEKELDYSKGLVSMGAFKWRKARAVAEVPRYAEKTPRNVNVRVSPRTIHQPR